MVFFRVAAVLGNALLLLVFLVSGITLAATIERIASNELVAEAALIFQGEVYESHAQMAPNGRIYTYIKFSVVDVLKGHIDSNSLQLRFTGGTVDERRLDLGVVIPRVGEHGIYFVESTSQPLANPLLGWQQGHFLISEDNHVTAGDGGTVVDVEAQAGSQTIVLSTGVAAGFKTLTPHRRFGTQPRPLTPEEFKAKIGELLVVSEGDRK
jgi:hypothetical protein